MGVPAFFAWLSKKYPSVVIDCVEEEQDPGSVKDTSGNNPNGVEFDNLYIDMNGIIHPCTHPTDRPPPQNEDDMMIAIFNSINRLFNIVRPRKLLYLAIDGVAPRAKMNQQRSRRFRAAKETLKKVKLIEEMRLGMEAKGWIIPPKKSDSDSQFDSNCITPGTVFMSRLTTCLNYYLHDRLTNDAAWKQLKVVLSDSSVPGEGEHKVMEFIRRQRGHPDHDPNTTHCLCGADADLIMLGLATHEPHFTIIREQFVRNAKRPCDICSLTAHQTSDCKGLPADGVIPIDDTYTGTPLTYIFVRLHVLREYLERELVMHNLPFSYDFERALDDWIFMCFFVGNDFLPHLPSLEIRENAIDRLVNIYKQTVYRTKGYLTESGKVNLDRVQSIMNDLGVMEDDIFKRRQSNEERYRRRSSLETRFRKTDLVTVQPPPDEVKLHEDGYKDRYYKSKFDIEVGVEEERHKICLEYVIGLSWVLKYYYQGCASWKWYYPYHYAPFASDFKNISRCNTYFPPGTHPLSPLEQLMSVLPPDSSSLVPPTFANLMTDITSPILDFYPKDFIVDMNGKRFEWQGVALLPFVDENRLKSCLSRLYKDLTCDQVKRNQCGHDRMYIGVDADCFSDINNLDQQIFQKKKASLVSDGLYGDVHIIPEEFFRGEVVPSPITALPNVQLNRVICVAYTDPKYPSDYTFKSTMLVGAEIPLRVVNQSPEVSKRQASQGPSLTRHISQQYYLVTPPPLLGRNQLSRGHVTAGSVDRLMHWTRPPVGPAPTTASQRMLWNSLNLRRRPDTPWVKRTHPYK